MSEVTAEEIRGQIKALRKKLAELTPPHIEELLQAGKLTSKDAEALAVSRYEAMRARKATRRLTSAEVDELRAKADGPVSLAEINASRPTVTLPPWDKATPAEKSGWLQSAVNSIANHPPKK
jgi:hypothetical protein